MQEKANRRLRAKIKQEKIEMIRKAEFILSSIDKKTGFFSWHFKIFMWNKNIEKSIYLHIKNLKELKLTVG